MSTGIWQKSKSHTHTEGTFLFLKLGFIMNKPLYNSSSKNFFFCVSEKITAYQHDFHFCLDIYKPLTIIILLGSLYLMLMVDPSGLTNRTGYILSYFCLPKRTTQVLLEFD